MEIKYTTVFDNTISAHIAWLVRFENVLNGTDLQTFDPKAVRDDTICEFGRWLIANPSVFPKVEFFEKVKNLHHDFHGKAAEIASLLGSKSDPTVIRQQLDQLQDISSQLVELLFDIQDFSKLKIK